MAFDLAGTTNSIIGFFSNLLFWFVFLVGAVVLGFLFLYMRKKRKLIYPSFILSHEGNGKMSFFETSAGWFKKKSAFFGLIDYGNEEILKTKQGERIQAGSTVDFHTIKGKRGLIMFRKEDDHKVLVPLTRMEVSNYQLIADIAPADYRDTSVEIVQAAINETKTTLERYLPAIIFGTLIVFCLIAIIIIVQFANHSVDTSKDLILKAGQIVASAQNHVNSAPSAAP